MEISRPWSICMDPARQAAAPSCSCCTHSCMAPARRAAAPSCRPAPPQAEARPAPGGCRWAGLACQLYRPPHSCAHRSNLLVQLGVFFLFSRVLDQAFHAYCSAVVLSSAWLPVSSSGCLSGHFQGDSTLHPHPSAILCPPSCSISLRGAHTCPLPYPHTVLFFPN
jgi:hypothetical protein